jgi:ABC-type glutathione transport system ATPase component
LHEGETLALIGESGCGKTTLTKALLRILPTNGTVDNGEVIYKYREVNDQYLTPDDRLSFYHHYGRSYFFGFRYTY